MMPERAIRAAIREDRGVALVAALIITLVVFMLIMSTLYVITGSTTMSGVGKRYTTAAEAADGAVEVTKELITLIIDAESIADLPVTVVSGNIVDTILLPSSSPSTLSLTLPGTELSSRYNATITLERFATKRIAGARKEFGQMYGAGTGNAIYFKIDTVVNETGPRNTKAENAVLYRLAR